MKKDMPYLTEDQQQILAEWYNNNFDKANNLFFDCEIDMDYNFLSDITKLNNFDNVERAINNFIVNVLAKGK